MGIRRAQPSNRPQPEQVSSSDGGLSMGGSMKAISAGSELSGAAGVGSRRGTHARRQAGSDRGSGEEMDGQKENSVSRQSGGGLGRAARQEAGGLEARFARRKIKYTAGSPETSKWLVRW